MYYYNVNGAALASLIPLEGLGPEGTCFTALCVF